MVGALQQRGMLDQVSRWQDAVVAAQNLFVRTLGGRFNRTSFGAVTLLLHFQMSASIFIIPNGVTLLSFEKHKVPLVPLKCDVAQPACKCLIISTF